MRIKNIVGVAVLVLFVWGVQADPHAMSSIFESVFCALGNAGDKFVQFLQQLAA